MRQQVLCRRFRTCSVILPPMGTTTKLDFPQFDGSGDALPWLDHWEHFFWHQLMPNDAKVSLATFHLEAEAQFWFVKHNLL